MNTLLKATAALAVIMSGTTAATAKGDGDIVVQSTSAMQEWAKDTNRSLDRNLATGSRFRSLGNAEGIVQIRFKLDEDGEPTRLEMYRSSGNVSADRVAKWAVSRLNNLDEAPVRNASAATFQANIIFANSYEQRDKLFAKLRQSEKTRLASNAEERSVISIGL